MLWTEPRPLEKQLQLLYIVQNGHFPRVQSGFGDGDRLRSNGVGPTVSILVARWDSDPDSQPVRVSVLPLDEGAVTKEPIRGRVFQLGARTRPFLFGPRPACRSARNGGALILWHWALHSIYQRIHVILDSVRGAIHFWQIQT